MTYDPDDKQYRCCCKTMHVQRGAFIIGIVGMILSQIALISSLAGQKGDPRRIGPLASFLACMLILAAQRKQNPSYYWPFLVLNMHVSFSSLLSVCLWLVDCWQCGSNMSSIAHINT
ncbi:hypothetical protein DdX_15538 [Ditylenchus destructor]|uniref:Uncharacterized protein n=1 Tax=Ditylenchus destructor TaxID=166010 RepID=A0AAD4MSL6_9BILA|nr:hypothetical protein DdX_15538 [Ditylenchus destructor]